MPIYLCRLLACFDKKLDKICVNKTESRLKHYCYFLMTNLLLADLHNKFTSKCSIMKFLIRKQWWVMPSFKIFQKLLNFWILSFKGFSPSLINIKRKYLISLMTSSKRFNHFIQMHCQEEELHKMKMDNYWKYYWVIISDRLWFQ